MRSELCKEDPSVDMVLGNITTTGGDVWKQTGEDGKGRDDPTRESDFEMEQVKETSKEA